MSLINIRRLTKRFGSTTVLNDVSFAVEPGEIFGFLGPNGAGKSTTIRCLLDYIRPTSGTVSVFGLDARTHGPALKRRLSYVPAEPTLYTHWTLHDHLTFIDGLQPIDWTRAEELQQLLQLDGHRRVRQLSTGNQQKVAIILALVRRPELLILDEPTRGLDPLLRATLHQLLRDYQTAGGTVLLSSHDLSEVEELCSNVAIIRDGRLVSDTSLAELKRANRHHLKLTFAGTMPDLALLKPTELVIAGQTARLTVQGDLNAALKLIARHAVKDIEISSASLEDIFMGMYR